MKITQKNFAIYNIDTKIKKALNKSRKNEIVKRIWEKDPTVWKKDNSYKDLIQNRLGWLSLPSLFINNCEEIKSFVNEVREEGFEYAVVLGMGGSSMCPEVCRETFGIKKNFLNLFVLDSTDPGIISDIEKTIDINKTLFIVSSKSGGTIEVDSFFRYFFEKVKNIKGENAGLHFIAITDPSTMLEERARENKFRKIFINPPDIGGRYSALSYFGLVPAALIGIDILKLLKSAEKEMNNSMSLDTKKNIGLLIGITAGELAKKGKDKLTFILSKDISSFGYWVEQLIAESTGKEGKGIVPVEGEIPGKQSDYSKDRVFVNIYTKKRKDKARKISATLVRNEFSVINIELEDKYSIGGQFYLWEFATAVMGYSLKINPFDEPNVKESKDNTSKVLSEFELSNKLPDQIPDREKKGLSLFSGNSLRVKNKNKKISSLSIEEYMKLFFKQKRKYDYIALMSYLQSNIKNTEWIGKIRELIKVKLKTATTSGYGPRFLHSTGQLHKGGKDNGMFIQIVCDDTKDLEIPGKAYSFSILKQSQALGDYESLLKHKRRVLKINIGKNTEKGLKNFYIVLEKVL